MKTLVKCFWIFLFGSFIGCIVEELWCLFRNKCFQIRSSLIHLPLIPIYGLASLLIAIIASIVGYDLWKVFFIGVIVSTTIEYVSSIVQERLFKTKSWDYSNFKFNLNGRVNLLYSIGFGIISMMFIKYIRNFSLYVNGLVYEEKFMKFTAIILIVFIIDVITSSFACIRYSRRKQGIKPSNSIDKYLDKHYPDYKIDKIYNNSVYVG